MTGRPLSLARIGLVLATLAGVAACVTVVVLAMRAVLDIGGVCASGGQRVSLQPCPQGASLVLIGGVWVGITLAITYGALTAGTGIPSFTGLFWPGLFLSLGWIFLQDAFSPPGGGGMVWGRFVPGLLFVIMGAVPLVWAIPALAGRSTMPFPFGPARLPSFGRLTQAVSATSAPGFLDEMERLDSLHRSGAIDDAEYQAAKRRLIEGGDG